jgi:hypothetical protein
MSVARANFDLAMVTRLAEYLTSFFLLMTLSAKFLGLPLSKAQLTTIMIIIKLLIQPA